VVSHVSSYATSIVFQHVAAGGALTEDPAWEILKDAVQAVAEARGGRVGDRVADVFGRSTRCDVALTLPDFRPGVGVRVDRRTGAVSFVYDAYGKPAEFFDSLTSEIVQNFTAIAVTRALRALNYQVELEEQGQGSGRRVVVRGVL
jgi:hypothetical protein